eukprot:TRINITY_DN859_c0_g1_i9.p2 TRINITY_DN859_c0_g1~~TRINITY_DN859_c0_g1_i9.p2  ORF type:complete len:312 (+),score=27.64 TRINITY_DN859_c0_g1_i9:143-1078(+)
MPSASDRGHHHCGTELSVHSSTPPTPALRLMSSFCSQSLPPPTMGTMSRTLAVVAVGVSLVAAATCLPLSGEEKAIGASQWLTTAARMEASVAATARTKVVAAAARTEVEPAAASMEMEPVMTESPMVSEEPVETDAPYEPMLPESAMPPTTPSGMPSGTPPGTPMGTPSGMPSSVPSGTPTSAPKRREYSPMPPRRAYPPMPPVVIGSGPTPLPTAMPTAMLHPRPPRSEMRPTPMPCSTMPEIPSPSEEPMPMESFEPYEPSMTAIPAMDAATAPESRVVIEAPEPPVGHDEIEKQLKQLRWGRATRTA